MLGKNSIPVFPTLFCLLAQQKSQTYSILLHNSDMNQFMLIAGSITGDSEKGDNLSRDHHFFGQHKTISGVIDHYFMAAFTQF